MLFLGTRLYMFSSKCQCLKWAKALLLMAPHAGQGGMIVQLTDLKRKQDVDFFCVGRKASQELI